MIVPLLSPKKRAGTSTVSPKQKMDTASLPRINKDMTVSQLQSECRARDPSIKSLAAKNNQLSVGSVWTEAGAKKKIAPAKKETKADVSVVKKSTSSVAKITKSDTPTPSMPSVKKRTIGNISNTSTTTKTIDSPAKKKKPSKKITTTTDPTKREPPSLASLPRITSSMTIAQLNHELHHRDPTVKGTSNQPKASFVERLGIGSIWTSAPEARNAAFNLATCPKISADLTMAHLLHEALERNPSLTALSSKKKDWFLNHLGIGSIWITATTRSTDKVMSLQGTNKKKDTSQQVESPVVKKTKVGLKGGSAKTSNNKNTAKLATGDPPPRANPKPDPQCSSGAYKVAKKPSTLKKSTPQPDPRCSSSSIAAANKKPSVVVAKSKKKSVADNPSFPDVSREGISGAKLRANPKPDLQCSSRTSTAAKKPPKLRKSTPQPYPGSSSSAIAVAAAANKKPPVVVAKKSKNNSAADAPSFPVVSTKLSVAELKAEYKTRFPDAKISSKSKSWLLENLGDGSFLEMSSEWQSKLKHEAEKLHVHSSRCHQQHLLADSTQLRASLSNSLGTRTLKRRVNNAHCERPHGFLCQDTAYRSCETCDCDICRACFDIESLPESQKQMKLKARRLELEARYEESRRKERELQRRYAEEERKREEQWARQQKERELELILKYQKDLKRFSPCVKNPTKKQKDETKKLEYTVWTSCGYENDGWHSYEGPPDKEFNSSFATLKEANSRVEYVFYYDNPWGQEKEVMHVDTDDIDTKGIRCMECHPDDSERWTVSVVPSIVFEYL